MLSQVLSILMHVFMMIFFVILIRFVWRITVIRMDIPYTGWDIPSGYSYLAVPISAFLMLLFTLADLDPGTQNEEISTE